MIIKGVDVDKAPGIENACNVPSWTHSKESINVSTNNKNQNKKLHVWE